MHRAGAIVLALALAATACSHAQDASTLPIGTRLTIETVDHVTLEATVADNPNAIEFRGPAGERIPADRVVRAVDVKRGRGAWEGFLAGALAGLAVGAAVGYADGDDQCGDFCILAFTAEEKAAMIGSLFGMVGGAGGILVGAIVGSRDIYTFGARGEYRIVPSGPPGSTLGASIRF